MEHGVNNVALADHEHFYERLCPKNGNSHLVLGNSGELRCSNLKRSANVAKGFDTGWAFALMETAGH